MYIVESQKLLGSFQAAISCSLTTRPFLAGPSIPPKGFNSSGPHSSKHATALCGGQHRYSLRMSFFYDQRRDRDVFQVRTRWAVSPSRRSSRPTHSSVTAGNSFSSATVLGQLPNRPNRER